jgi:hypothetical protein
MHARKACYAMQKSLFAPVFLTHYSSIMNHATEQTMPQFMTHCWRTLSDSLGRARERKLLREATLRMNACSCHADEPSHAERLEHIALYARAGYFNMGYTVDAFQTPGETPLH